MPLPDARRLDRTDTTVPASRSRSSSRAGTRRCAGCLRFLADGADIEAMLVPEIAPLYGTLVAFARADDSWHGHLPFEGERRVLRVAWLTREDDLLRKQRRGRFSRRWKKPAGGMDRRFGAGRDANARHD